MARSTDVEDVRGHLAKMIEQGRSEDALDLVAQLLDKLKDENLRLGLELFKLMKQHTGRRGEGVSTKQLDMFLWALGKQNGAEPKDPKADEESAGSEEAAEAKNEPEPEPEPKRKKKKKPRRRKLPAHLRRETTIIKVPEKQRRCDEHGDKSEIGYDDSEVLHFRPASFYVELIRREKLACRLCGDGVAVAPAANKVVDGGMAGPGLIADLLIGKFRDHLPLSRQIRRYARLGVKLPSSTVGDWVGQGADLIEPLVKLEADNVLGSFLMQTDDSGLKVLDRNAPGNIKRGFLWVHVGDHRHCYVMYTPNKEYADPDKPNPALEYLKKREGYIQADAFPGYNTVFDVAGSKSIEVACWMHARRYFVVALESGDLRAAIPLKLIKGMYEIEAEATEARASPGERLEMRLTRSAPLRDELGKWIAKYHPETRPKSPLAKAMGYALNQWDALQRPFEDGRIPLDNGESERRLREVAMGRRNYLFAGSDTGAKRAAIVYSILGGCALNAIEPWAYLNDIMQRIVDGWPMSRLHELLPANYAALIAAEAPDK